MSKLGTQLKKLFLLPLIGLVFVLVSFTLTPAASAIDGQNEETTTAQEETVDRPANGAEGTSPDTNADNMEETTPDTDAEDGAETDTAEDAENDTDTVFPTDEEAENICTAQAGALAWFICPTSGFFAKAVDGIYNIISNLLTIHPIIDDTESPVYIVWEYIRNITNIIFIIFMIVVIYMQITGLGESKYNYTIKRALPRLALSAVVVNLSFIISALAVDLSNVLGYSLKDFFESIRNIASANATIPYVSWSDLITALTIGGSGVFLVNQLTGGSSREIIYIVIVALLCALIAVIVGLVVIAMRQALVYLLVMISPIAFVAYLLPNTEHYFATWKKIFLQMLIFFPMFSVLFGASQLAGWVVMGLGGIYIVLGMAIQIVPLVLSISLIKMSGTVLGGISKGLSHLTNPAEVALRGWGASKRQMLRTEKLERDMENHGDRLNPFSPGSWNAWRGYERFKRAERIKMSEEKIAGFGTENINALKTGRRIIARDHLGNPVYSSHPIKVNPWMRREAERRDIANRVQGDSMNVDNFHNTLGTQLKAQHIADRELSERASNQIRNDETIRTAKNAAVNNARADERFYMERVRKAATEGRDSDAYQRLIATGAGADYYNDDGSIRNNAVNAVIANAYTSYEKERQDAVGRTKVYLDKLITADVERLYRQAWDNKDIDTIVAANQVLAFRGDYDKIMKQASEHMDQEGYAVLGTDFTNMLAASFMSMKNDAPVLGRFGKHLNLETAHYTFEDDPSKKRCNYVTMKEYFTGYDDKGNATKRSVVDLLTGTPIDRIDRTAFRALNDGINRYFTAENLGSDEAVEARYAKLNAEMLSDVVNGTFAFGNKSEQMFSALNHYTGLTINQKDNKWYGDKNGNPGKKNEHYREATLTFLGAHNNVGKLARMKSSTFDACMTRLTIENNGDRAKAEDQFRQIFIDNGVLDAIQNSKNSGAIAGMDAKVRIALGLTPQPPGSKSPPTPIPHPVPHP